MAALVVQSRFAGLKIEDDDGFQTTTQKVKKAKPTAAKKPEPPKKTTKITATNGIKPQVANQPKKKKHRAGATTSEQWEEWKQKDEQMVDGNFENELQQAIMLSKLDFEEKKDVYKLHKKDADVQKKTPEQTKAGTKKQKKKNVMSLDQFNSMVSGDDAKGNIEEEKESTASSKSTECKDTEFFERVKDETRDELIKDQIIDRVKNRKPLSNELMTRVQFADAMERKNKEIGMLRHEIDRLKEDLLTVKSRNRKLCNILGQGEMKDKAEVLVELERLRGVQAELTAEVSALHTELERERSKNADPRAKDKKKKGGNSDKDK